MNRFNEKIMIRLTLQKNNQDFVADEMHQWWKDWVFIDARGEVK